MSDDLISRQAAEMALIEKGQHSRRYKWGEIWELNGLEIRTDTVLESLMIWDLKRLAVNSAAIIQADVKIVFLYTAKIVPSISRKEV